MIAIALACRPQVLIADEPTTALDVTIQIQILGLLRELCNRLGMSILFITHDMGVIAQLVDRVAVMYAGRIVETAAVAALFAEPGHHYTRGLMDCMPARNLGVRRLPTIPGQAPQPGTIAAGCVLRHDAKPCARYAAWRRRRVFACRRNTKLSAPSRSTVGGRYES